MTVTHLYYPSAHCCGFRVVGDHDDGLIEAIIQFLKHIQNDLGILGIQVPRGFIRQHYCRSRDHRACEGYPLLLAA